MGIKKMEKLWKKGKLTHFVIKDTTVSTDSHASCRQGEILKIGCFPFDLKGVYFEYKKDIFKEVDMCDINFKATKRLVNRGK